MNLIDDKDASIQYKLATILTSEECTVLVIQEAHSPQNWLFSIVQDSNWKQKNEKMKIQTHPPVFDVIQPSKRIVLLYLDDLTFRLITRFFSILNGEGEIFCPYGDCNKIPSKFRQKA